MSFLLQHEPSDIMKGRCRQRFGEDIGDLSHRAYVEERDVPCFHMFPQEGDPGCHVLHPFG